EMSRIGSGASKMNLESAGVTPTNSSSLDPELLPQSHLQCTLHQTEEGQIEPNMHQLVCLLQAPGSITLP
ncbi:hypothetical protein PIB30_006055, partial [Stylosanthes scabra]|nr:hypothetical protein [Stylosanthes scabra]